MSVRHVSGHIYSASGCGSAIEVACYDPYESTGAHKGWADGATAGNRVRCESLVQRRPPPVLSSGNATATPSSSAATKAGFDRPLAAKLLAASAERARTCSAPGGMSGPGRARITFAPSGERPRRADAVKVRAHGDFA